MHYCPNCGKLLGFNPTKCSDCGWEPAEVMEDAMQDDLESWLRSGHHNRRMITVSGVDHDERCLLAAERIAKLEQEVANLRLFKRSFEDRKENRR